MLLYNYVRSSHMSRTHGNRTYYIMSDKMWIKTAKYTTKDR